MSEIYAGHFILQLRSLWTEGKFTRSSTAWHLRKSVRGRYEWIKEAKIWLKMMGLWQKWAFQSITHLRYLNQRFLFKNLPLVLIQKRGELSSQYWFALAACVWTLILSVNVTGKPFCNGSSILSGKNDNLRIRMVLTFSSLFRFITVEVLQF